MLKLKMCINSSGINTLCVTCSSSADYINMNILISKLNTSIFSCQLSKYSILMMI